jgi:DNA-binding MarR family transcriptional regulator
MHKTADNQAVNLRLAISALLRLFLVNERRFPVAGRNERYSPLDFQALNYLALHPGAKVGALGDFMSVAPTTTTTLTDRMVRRGLVRRAPHPQDKRATALWLTDSGQTTFDAIYAQDILNMQAILDVLPDSDRAALVSIMTRVVKALQAD